MRWLLGIFVGIFVIFLVLFGLKQTGHPIDLENLLQNGFQTSDPEIEIEVSDEAEGLRDDEVIVQVVVAPPAEPLDVDVVEDAAIVLDAPSASTNEFAISALEEALGKANEAKFGTAGYVDPSDVVESIAVRIVPDDAVDPVLVDENEAEVSEMPAEDVEAPADIDPVASETIDGDDTGLGVEVKVGAQSIVEPVLANSSVAEPEVEDTDLLPENIKLIVSETADFRLSLDDAARMPRNTYFSVWPDSPIVQSGLQFYLMNPPNDIMDSYKLKDVVADEGDLYAKAFDESAGIYVRKLDALAEVSPFSKLIYQQLAQKQKSLVVYNAYFDPQFNELLRETQADFHRVDYVFEQTSRTATLQQQWDAMLDKARHGEEILVLYEIGSDGTSLLENVIASPN